MEDDVALLRDYFIHRDNVYARQWYSKERKDGGYIKVTMGECPPDERCPRGACPHKVPVPLTDDVLATHLTGRQTIGVYQLQDDDTVRWLCFDIDKDKDTLTDETMQQHAQEQARCIARSCQRLGLAPLVEDSGNRGYHVWLFTEPTMPATKAQAIGRLVLADIKTLPGLHIELFPKQVSVKSYGNLVKLPLGVHRKSGRRSCFVGPQFTPMAEQMAALRRTRRLTEAEADTLLAAHHIEIEPIRRAAVSLVSPHAPLCMPAMLNQGVTDGARDVAAFRLSCYLREQGIPIDYAHLLMSAWDAERNDPPLGPALITVKVESAYSDSYSSFPCKEYALDRFCDPACFRYERKLKQRQAAAVSGRTAYESRHL